MIGRVFFARISDALAPFSEPDHAREDLVVMSASVSHARGEAAIIELETVYPDGGLLGGDRYGILSAEFRGSIIEIARGEIAGFPIAVAGQTVRIELICRQPSHADLVDALYARESARVPAELEDLSSPRRAEGYLLDEVFHHKTALIPMLSPISGGRAPAAILYGEGAEAGQSEIFDMSIEITEAPARSVTVTSDLVFTELAWGQIDIGDMLTASVDDHNRATYTPHALARALQQITLDGGYELLSSALTTVQDSTFRVYSGAQTVDQSSCQIIPAERTIFRKHKIDGLRMNVAVSASQPRGETIAIRVEPVLEPFGGEIDASERLTIADCETRARTTTRISYSPDDQTHVSLSRSGVSGSIFSSGGQFRSSCADIYDAIVRRAARIAIERAHCVRLTISTTADAILRLDLRDRVEVRDARLPGGVATGKIIGWDVSLAASQTGQLVLSVPISGRSGNDSAARVVPAPPAFAQIPTIASTPTISAVRSGSTSFFVEQMSIIDPAPDQEFALSGSTPTAPISDPADKMPPSGLSIALRDLSPLEPDQIPTTEVIMSPVSLILPDGIAL